MKSARTKTYLAAQFRRISGRRGKKRAESRSCTFYFNDRLSSDIAPRTL